MSNLNLREHMPESEFTSACSNYLHFNDARPLSVRRQHFQAALKAFEAHKAVDVPGPLRRVFLAWLGALPEQQDIPSEPVIWDGQGLPPVGTVCEYNWGMSQWLPATVFAIKQNGSRISVLFEYEREDGSPDWSYSFNANNFRPFRTAEQIAAEVREKAINAMLAAAGITDSAFSEDPEAFTWAAALYDAGYRRQETAE